MVASLSLAEPRGLWCCSILRWGLQVAKGLLLAKGHFCWASLACTVAPAALGSPLSSFRAYHAIACRQLFRRWRLGRATGWAALQRFIVSKVEWVALRRLSRLLSLPRCAYLIEIAKIIETHARCRCIFTIFHWSGCIEIIEAAKVEVGARGLLLSWLPEIAEIICWGFALYHFLRLSTIGLIQACHI